jgi:hypothetical protein
VRINNRSGRSHEVVVAPVDSARQKQPICFCEYLFVINYTKDVFVEEQVSFWI